uniref:Uncharacterized protein n=1 Tax=Rhizophora mucronata TaxID=61149 RepID=A0A2P2PCU9_RHIMU
MIYQSCRFVEGFSSWMELDNSDGSVQVVI